MKAFIVQIRRGTDWNTLTTFRVRSSGRDDLSSAIDAAKRQAERALTGWRDYFGAGHHLRIEEVA
jgi:hypothetical protein